MTYVVETCPVRLTDRESVSLMTGTSRPKTHLGEKVLRTDQSWAISMCLTAHNKVTSWSSGGQTPYRYGLIGHTQYKVIEGNHGTKGLAGRESAARQYMQKS